MVDLARDCHPSLVDWKYPLADPGPNLLSPSELSAGNRQGEAEGTAFGKQALVCRTPFASNEPTCDGTKGIEKIGMK